MYYKKILRVSKIICFLLLFSNSSCFAQQWDTVSIVKNNNSELKRITNVNYCQTDYVEVSNNYNVQKDKMIPCIYNLNITLKWPNDAYGNTLAIPNQLYVSLWNGSIQVAQVLVVNNEAKFEDVLGNINYDIKISSPSLPNYSHYDAALMFSMGSGSINQTFFKMRALDVDQNSQSNGMDLTLLANAITHNQPTIVEPYEIIDSDNVPSSYYDTHQMIMLLNDNISTNAFLVIRGYIKY